MNLSKVVDNLRGQIAWNVCKGYGSFITMEFGAPRLDVREPVADAASAILRKRRVKIVGDWHVWIYMCDWSIFNNDVLLANCEADDATIMNACANINGQALTDIQVDRDLVQTLFVFDDGGKIVTSRGGYDADTEQWLVYGPTGFALDFRNDGKFGKDNAS